MVMFHILKTCANLQNFESNHLPIILEKGIRMSLFLHHTKKKASKLSCLFNQITIKNDK